MGSFGFLIQLLAMLLGILAAGAYYFSFKEKNSNYAKYGDQMVIAQFALTTVACLILMVALIQGNFRLEYVAQYTDSSLPLIYKITALWAGQAGSLLFWGWLVTLFVAIEMVRIKGWDVKYRSTVFLVSALTASFFLFLTSFVTNPFAELDFMPQNGMGMNPLLQNPGMIYHPPLLYLGYVGFTIPLGHALAAIVTGDLSSTWAKASRGWTIWTWVFLTLGIVLGGQWAYVELGWGGYWAWDPVENASLLPWFTGTAFAHSIIMYERKNRLKLWSFMLILASYELAIFGTFLTRSGVMDSVHSFGKSSLGPFFLIHMAVSIAIVTWMILRKKNELKDGEDFDFLSREGVFYIANWLFVGITFVVTFGTILPILTQMIGVDKITVGIPYYNRVTIPFFIGILVAAGLAPHLPYGETKTDQLVKSILPGIVVGVLTIGICYISGYTLPMSLALFGVTAFALTAIVMQIVKLLKAGGFDALLKARRLVGGMIIHLGVVMIAFGVIASSFYKQEAEHVVKSGDTITFGEYQLRVGEIDFREGANYASAFAPISVFKDGKFIITLMPEKRFYENNENVFGEVAIDSTMKGDLYIILASYSKPERMVGLQVIFEPMIAWIWIGTVFMTLGALFGLSRRRETNG